jgi:hypothetical protein
MSTMLMLYGSSVQQFPIHEPVPYLFYTAEYK